MYISEQTSRAIRNYLLEADQSFRAGDYELGSRILKECINKLVSAEAEDSRKKQRIKPECSIAKK